jgi:uncharacterized protein YjbI with pentapeptide repeats
MARRVIYNSHFCLVTLRRSLDRPSGQAPGAKLEPVIDTPSVGADSRFNPPDGERLPGSAKMPITGVGCDVGWSDLDDADLDDADLDDADLDDADLGDADLGDADWTDVVLADAS